MPPAGRLAIGCGATSLVLQALSAAAGDNAAVPGLGALTVLPPWDAGLGWSSATVTVVLLVADLLGVAAVGLGLLAVRDGARLPARSVAVAGVGMALALTLVPPLGSADHLSYLAYGRIAAAGDDPYTVRPDQWHGGQDPVAGAVQPPWQGTPSVYGPVATALQAGVAELGGGSLRRSVWVWQLLCAAAFVLVGRVLARLCGHDPATATRAAVLWTLNPLLLGQLVLGAHVDVVAAAAAMLAVALVATSPLAAGVLVGVAAGVKVPYVLVGLAACWGLRHLPRPEGWRRLGLGVAGALLVLVPAHLWSGPHTYSQLRQASRFVSFATPWRIVVDRLDPILGTRAVRPVIGPIALTLAVVLAVLLARRLARVPTVPLEPVTAATGRAFAVLACAWVLTVPYALPWYDAMAWAPLPLVGATFLDVALLARLGVLALAYVPGRVVGLSPTVEHLTLGARRYVAPWLLLAVLGAVLAWALTEAWPASWLRRWRGLPGPPRPAPARER